MVAAVHAAPYMTDNADAVFRVRNNALNSIPYSFRAKQHCKTLF